MDERSESVRCRWVGRLGGVLTGIFNLSLAFEIVPNRFETATIVPVSKHSTASALNNFCLVALTPIKCFKRLVLPHLKASLPTALDPHQFAYRTNWCTEDAISTSLHSSLTKLDSPNSYIRRMFVDFSSAFNTMFPSMLVSS